MELYSIKDCRALLSKVRNAEHFDFHWEAILFLTEAVKPFTALTAVWNTYNELFKQEDILFKQSSAYPETVALRELDSTRDRVFLSIKQKIVATLYSDGAIFRNAAQQLDHVIRIYKDANRKPYTEKSALMLNMIQDLRLPEYKDSVETVNIKMDIDALDMYNNDFIKEYTARSVKKEEKELLGKLQYIRQEVNDAFTDLTFTINTLYSANELTDKDADIHNGLYAIIKTLNGYIKELENVYNRRNPKKKPDPKPGPEPPPVPEPPHFKIREQNTIDRTHMHYLAADPVIFAATLYPNAIGGEVQYRLEGSWDANLRILPIESFAMDNESNPIGIIVNNGQTGLYFPIPFMSWFAGEMHIVKNGTVLAILDNALAPHMTT